VGTRESYEPGTFSWAELATTDADGAKSFYSAVFGWSYDDNEVPDGGGTYSMAQVDGTHVGAIFQADGPARWNSYITVEDAAETAEKAREAGATIHAEPFDVGDAGKMAVIQDPTGGVFSIWEPKDHIGAGLVNAHGALAWNDLMTYDVGEASEFYCELFGWEVAPVDMSGRPETDDDEDDEDDEDESDDGESDDDDDDDSDDDDDGDDSGGGVTVDPNDATDAPGYEESDSEDDDDPDDEDDDDEDDDDDDEDDEDEDEDDAPGSQTTRGPDERMAIKNGERLNGGIATIPEAAGDAIPPHWLPYFGVESIEAALTAVRDGGGTVMADPVEVPTGKIAVLADPQGAVFAIFRGELED
jgi:predicted enzyme related to lactoylglutathione lyase